MANRIGTFPTFANLAPPWSLPTLDSNFVSINTFGNDSSLGFVNGILTDTGAVNAYQVTCTYGSPTAYNPGMCVAFVPANSNTGASTIQVLPLGGTAAIVDAGGNALGANALIANTVAFLVLIGTQFRLINPGSTQLISNPIVTVAGVTTINCAHFSGINITVDSTGAPTNASITLQLTNVNWGAHIDVMWAPRGPNQFLFFSNACTDQAANAITPITIGTSGGTQTSLIGSGINTVTNWLELNGAVHRNAAGAGSTAIRFVYGYN